MSTNDSLERLVADRLASDAAGYDSVRALDDALAMTSRMRPYPQWLALMKEPPMRISAPVAVGSPTVRLVSLLVLTLLLAVVAGGAVVAGASLLPSPDRPAPFGPARNGSIAYELAGDIYLADADGTNGHIIVDDPDLDVVPWFSRDGTRLAFIRDPDGQAVLMVAEADGTDARPVVDRPWCMDFMPDGTSLVGTRMVDGERRLSVVDIASGQAQDIELGGIVPSSWCPVIARPPDGQEVIFTGWPTLGSSDKGIYAVRTDRSSPPRRIGELATAEAQPESETDRPGAGDSISFQDMHVSPDGTTVAYWSWEPSEARYGELGATAHQRDLTGGTELAVIESREPGQGVLPVYSPDGKSVVFEGHVLWNSPEHLFQVPVDGSTPAEPFGDEYSFHDRQGFDMSPDGTKVLFTTRGGATRLVDVETGEPTPLDLVVSPESLPSWQRLAP